MSLLRYSNRKGGLSQLLKPALKSKKTRGGLAPPSENHPLLAVTPRGILLLPYPLQVLSQEESHRLAAEVAAVAVVAAVAAGR